MFPPGAVPVPPMLTDEMVMAFLGLLMLVVALLPERTHPRFHPLRRTRDH